MKTKKITKSKAILFIFMFVALFSFNTVTIKVSAAEAETLDMKYYEESGERCFEFDNVLEDSTMNIDLLDDNADFEIVLLAADDDTDSKTDDGGEVGADASFKKVVEFFTKWLRRVGALVALVGAIMFGFAIKNNDAEQKQNGLLTLVAGFVVAAICTGVSMFDIFS